MVKRITPEEIEFIKNNINILSNSEIAKSLGRTYSSTMHIIQHNEIIRKKLLQEKLSKLYGYKYSEKGDVILNLEVTNEKVNS